jgi:hypothetical protein
MREDEFEQWLSRMRDGYAEEMVVNGRASEDRARDKAVKDLEQLFPGGAPSADQSVFVIEADGRPVGSGLPNARATFSTASGSTTSISTRQNGAAATARQRWSMPKRKRAAVA